MNPSLQRLSDIAAKPSRTVVGLMSGTSMDGLDIALCDIRGHGKETRMDLRAFQTVSYPQWVRQMLGKLVSSEQISAEELTLAHSRLGDFCADLVLEALRQWEVEPVDVDCIASHGQTLYHAPRTKHGRDDMPNATLQIVDGDHIARKTGILTLSDFRQKHTAAGGEGAPMVVFAEQLLFRDPRADRILLNIGGIANLTLLPKKGDDGEAIATDTGPGNTLINAAMRELFGEDMDRDGQTAVEGSVHPQLLKHLLRHPFFRLEMPKTTGPEMFNMHWVRKSMYETASDDISREDLVATLSWLTAQTIADAIQELSDNSDLPEIYLSGGGMHNSQLVAWLGELLEDEELHSFEEIGFDPDAKEAACFAVLANEMLAGEGFLIHPKENTGRRVNFGKISLPV